MVSTINALLEDTCVLITIAFLLTRGKLLALLLKKDPTPREAATLGGFFALVAALQDLLPDAHTSYSPPTLVVTFATLIGGPTVGLLAAVGAVTNALLLRETPVAMAVPPAVLVCILVGQLIPARFGWWGGAIAGVLSQALAIGVNLGMATLQHSRFDLTSALLSVPANGFGILLMLLIVQDAQVRAEAIRHAVEVEHARTLLAEAQLAALRARLKPHFLFNTLNSIAALCAFDPPKAESATVRLGLLMRRTLERDVNRAVTLTEELESARAYLEIESLRLGARLRVNWQVEEEALSASLPPLALLTLLENAILHGIGPRPGPGTLTITIRQGKHQVLVAVTDDGLGISPEGKRKALATQERPHGLALVRDQLVLLYGPSARLRLFGETGRGTMAAFQIPIRGRI